MGVIERFKQWREERRLLKACAAVCMEAEHACMLGDFKYAGVLFKRFEQLKAEYNELRRAHVCTNGSER